MHNGWWVGRLSQRRKPFREQCVDVAASPSIPSEVSNFISPLPTPPHTHTPTDGETGPERSSGLLRVLGIVHYQSGAFSDTDLCIFYQCPKSKCISTWVYSWARRAPKTILQNGDHPAAFFPSSLAVSLPRNLVSQPDAKSLSRPFSVTAPPSGLTGAE